MADLHRLLRRQIKRHLPKGENIPEEWREFIEAVNNAYHQFDDDREMLERSLDLSSQELLQVNADLKNLLNELDVRVRERTTELNTSNARLRAEIAEREQVELRLRESEESLRKMAGQVEESLRKTRNVLDNILESMPSAIIGLDTQGVITHWNKSAASLSGKGAELVIDSPVATAFPWLGTQKATIKRVLQTGRVVNAGRIHFKKGKKNLLLETTIFPLLANGVEGAVIRLDDVTERAHLEEIMVQTEKMMTVGGLAAGMAHEINNPLGGILQCAQVILNRLRTESPVNLKAASDVGCSFTGIMTFIEQRGILDMLEGVRESASKAASIVAHMLEFSRKSDLKRHPVDLGKLADKAVELCTHDYDLNKLYDFRKIEIIRNFAQNLPLVPCISTQIEQVILNLLRNATQAMREADVPNPQVITLSTCLDGETALFVLEDNGPGMDDETRRRVFEPFFSTKAPGKGTGLGLSVSYFIITQNHGGMIQVESELGKGTKFIISLPLRPRSSLGQY